MSGIGGHQSASSASDEWLTPPWLLEALGGSSNFDLDPCAPGVRPWDMAVQHYSVADNGLIKPWWGRVWLNPPYSQPVVGRWLGRMAEHGHGLALIFARTETEAFRDHVWRQADALFFLEGRLTFHHVDGRLSGFNAGAPSVLCAYGEDDADCLAGTSLAGQFVPLRLRTLVFGYNEPGTWLEEVERVMRQAARPMTLAALYQCLAGSPKAKRNANWQAKIRQTLQLGPFARLGYGLWELAT